MLKGVLQRLTLAVVFLAALVSSVQANEKVTLRMVCWDGPEAMVALRKAVAQFEKKYPHIDVDLQSVAYGTYFSKLLAQYAAKVSPDVVMMGPDQFQRFSRRGALLPLNQFFDDIEGFDIRRYYKEIVDAHSTDGLLYVLPRDIAPISLIYVNKQHLAELGLHPDDLRGWTWDFEPRPELRHKDFFWVIEQLRKKDPQTGRTTRWGYAPGWQHLWTETMYLSLGKKLYDNYKEPTKVLLDDPEMMRIFQFSADLALKKNLMPSGLEMSSVLQLSSRQMFSQGKVSMFHSGIWETPELRKQLIPGTPGFFDWDIVLAPAYKNGTLRTPTGGSGYGVMSQTKHPKESWLLTAWMAGEPGMLAMAEAGLAQPAIADMAKKAPWVPDRTTPKDQQYPRNRIITHLAVPNVVFNPSAPYVDEVSQIMQQPYSLVYDGTSTAQEQFPKFAKLAQDRMDFLRQQQNLPRYNWAIGTLVGLALLGSLVAWIYTPELKIRRTHRAKLESRTAYLFIAPFIIGMLVFTVGPMILSLLMSFADWDIITPARWRGFGNFQEAFFVDPTFWPSVRVTFVYTFVSVPLGLITALLLAMLLNTKVKGMPLWRTCYYIPSIASGVAAALIWRRVFGAEEGLLNSIIYGPDGQLAGWPLARLLDPLATTSNDQVNWLGNERTALAALILMSLWGAGGGMVIILAGLQGVPEHYYEAATLDGASPWKKLLNVTLPLISPTLFFSLITGFIGSFQAFTSAFLMTSGGPNNSTMFFMLHLWNSAFTGLRMGYASMLAWVLFFIILVFTVIQLRASKWVYYEGK